MLDLLFTQNGRNQNTQLLFETNGAAEKESITREKGFILSETDLAAPEKEMMNSLAGTQTKHLQRNLFLSPRS